MAYLYRSPQDSQDPQAPNASQGAAAGTSSPAAPASSGGGVGAASTAAVPQATTGQFPGVMAYLNANKDAGAALASRAQGQVAGEVKGAQDDIAKQGEAWRSTNQGAVDKWQRDNAGAYQLWSEQQEAARKSAGDKARAEWELTNSRGGGSSRDGTTAPAAPRDGTTAPPGPRDGNPASPVDNTADLAAAYQRGYSGYQGPAFTAAAYPTLTDWTPDTSKVTQARGDLVALGTDAGREAFLGLQGGGGAIPSGATQLDAALLGRGLGASDPAGQYGGILSALSAPSQPTIADPRDGVYAGGRRRGPKPGQ